MDDFIDLIPRGRARHALLSGESPSDFLALHSFTIKAEGTRFGDLLLYFLILKGLIDHFGSRTRRRMKGF